jgi:DNA polymerase-2
LIYRSEKNNIDLVLGREPTIPLKKPVTQGTSYFSYGRTYFKPTAINLLGRIHIDKDNSFIYNDSRLQGLYEVARVCRIPLHTAARASIGKCLSSLQFYYAIQNRILIPWKPVIAEHFKTLGDLLMADRGGFIFEPEIGVHEQVAEFDFVSLYPNIMLKKNLSAETVNCDCCQDSKLRVPELNYNICQKRIGIIPTSLKIVLEKRAIYKHLLKSKDTDSNLRSIIYDLRQTSSATLPSSVMHKYFELLILALVIPSIGINAYGILLVGSHLYLPDAPYLSFLFALFIPAGAILFLVRKLRIAYKTNISSG